MKIISVVGARPNFMKVAPLHRALLATGKIDSRILHTGQHYDEKMSDIFFKQLGMPEPHVYLGIGSGSHAEQTGKVMIGFEKVLKEECPDMVIVVGDVNSTLACSITAVKCGVPVAHVEAGLRSFDRTMPEEINRLVTDSISDYLFVTEQSGMDNLLNEGVSPDRVFFVGNVMIDSLVQFREKASMSTILTDLGLSESPFALMTLHRPVNVDFKEGLSKLLRIIESTAREIPLVFPLHPRTRKQLETFGLQEQLTNLENVTLTEPLGYLEFLRLMDTAKVVITDSGGIQEETTYLRVPCLTLRENTERPITITTGTNELLPLDHKVVAEHLGKILTNDEVKGSNPPLWDGKASDRIAEQILKLHNMIIR